MLQLKLNGRIFGGWTEAVITRGIAQLASTFELKITDRWEGETWNISPFDECQVLWKGEPILTGYIDGNEISYDAESHEFTITGRSKTGDLVDCSAVSRQYKNQTFQQIAQALCGPFGVSVVDDAGDAYRFPTWKPDEGVQVFEALEKLARLRGLLLMDNGDGNVVIARAGSEKISTPLKLGENIKAGSGSFNASRRFSEYVIKAQQKGNDNSTAAYSAHVKARVSDSRVPRYRPLILQSEDQADTATAAKRAQWESNVRFGQSQSFNYSVQGWEHDAGLWQPNKLVPVTDSLLGIDDDLIIASARYVLNDKGSVTQLSLAHPLAFLPEPVPVKNKSSKSGKSVERWQELNG